MKLDDSKLVKLKSKEPSIGEIVDVLNKIADVMSYNLVDDGDFVFFAKKEDSMRPIVTRMHTIYDSHEEAYSRLLEEVTSKGSFYDGKLNLFCGCKSLEEAMVRADLLEDVR